jgi:hypothetical protein
VGEVAWRGVLGRKANMKLWKPIWIAVSALVGLILPVRSGILILIVPPTFMTIGVIIVCYRRRNQVRRTEDVVEAGQACFGHLSAGSFWLDDRLEGINFLNPIYDH